LRVSFPNTNFIFGIEWCRTKKPDLFVKSRQVRRTPNMDGSEPSTLVPAEVEGHILSTFVSHSAAGFLMLDHKLHLMEVSPRWASDWDVRRDELVGKHHYEVYPDLPEHVVMAHRRGLAGETVSASDDRFIMKGEEYHCAWQVRPWGNPTRGSGGIIIYAENLALSRRSSTSSGIQSGRPPAEAGAQAQELSWARDGRLATQDLLSTYREIACTCPPGHYDEHRSHSLECRAHPTVPVLRRAEQGIRNLVLLEQRLGKTSDA
jgi:hypothetical protein